jgi:hypothetical protein
MENSAIDRLKKAMPGDTELLELVKLGLRFKKNQFGGKPRYFSKYLVSIVKDIQKPTFKNILYQLELESARRGLHGEKASPVEKVDRIWELVTYHDPKKGRVQMPFGTLRNHLTKAKKKLTNNVRT